MAYNAQSISDSGKEGKQETHIVGDLGQLGSTEDELNFGSDIEVVCDEVVVHRILAETSGEAVQGRLGLLEIQHVVIVEKVEGGVDEGIDHVV